MHLYATTVLQATKPVALQHIVNLVVGWSILVTCDNKIDAD